MTASTVGDHDAASRAAVEREEPHIWLHVEHDNDEALALFTSSGSQFHSTDPWWYFGKRKLLLWKELPRVCMKASRSAVSAGPAENI